MDKLLWDLDMRAILPALIAASPRATGQGLETGNVERNLALANEYALGLESLRAKRDQRWTGGRK